MRRLILAGVTTSCVLASACQDDVAKTEVQQSRLAAQQAEFFPGSLHLCLDYVTKDQGRTGCIR